MTYKKVVVPSAGHALTVKEFSANMWARGSSTSTNSRWQWYSASRPGLM